MFYNNQKSTSTCVFQLTSKMLSKMRFPSVRRTRLQKKIPLLMHIIFVATDYTFWYRQAFSYPFNIGATMNESKLKHNKIYMNGQILTLKEIINIVEILI